MGSELQFFLSTQKVNLFCDIIDLEINESRLFYIVSNDIIFKSYKYLDDFDILELEFATGDEYKFCLNKSTQFHFTFKSYFANF